jgi:DNA (cytosine-5)-methyltransferase 1
MNRLFGVASPARPLDAEFPTEFRAAEFFAGIGLARLGLEAAGFRVLWANDIDQAKQRMYSANFPGGDFLLGDVSTIRGPELPDDLSLAWASFPCTDVSLAGNRAGLAGTGSGTFWQFARILDELGDRRPPVVALENVVGLATSHGGHDIRAAISELNRLGYWVDILLLDARRFVPQSRQRLFLIAMTERPEVEDEEPSDVRPAWLNSIYHDPALRIARTRLPAPPPMLRHGLADVIEELPPDSDAWWDDARTGRLVESLSPLQRQRIDALQGGRKVTYRTAYRRTRNGVAVWEIRPDDISGCLRTARGGSSKQALVAVGRGSIRARWMTPREYARLMGADDYQLDGIRRNEALFGFGDAVCVPVIAWLSREYLAPALARLERRHSLVAAGG